jgi:hypothetical protein
LDTGSEAVEAIRSKIRTYLDEKNNPILKEMLNGKRNKKNSRKLLE